MLEHIPSKKYLTEAGVDPWPGTIHRRHRCQKKILGQNHKVNLYCILAACHDWRSNGMQPGQGTNWAAFCEVLASIFWIAIS